MDNLQEISYEPKTQWNKCFYVFNILNKQSVIPNSFFYKIRNLNKIKIYKYYLPIITVLINITYNEYIIFN